MILTGDSNYEITLKRRDPSVGESPNTRQIEFFHVCQEKIHFLYHIIILYYSLIIVVNISIDLIMIVCKNNYGFV